MKVALLVTKVLVAGIGPLADERAATFRPLVPVALAGGGTSYDKLSYHAGTLLAAILVHNLDLVSGHRLAGGSKADVARAVAHECLQHFGRPETVEDIHSDQLAPAFTQMRWQSFACGNGKAQTV